MLFETMDLAGKLAGGFGLTILGMGVVFLILLILSLSLDGLRLFFSGEPKLPLPTEKQAPPAPDREDGAELVAVITAAVAAYTESRPEEIRVRSIRKRSENRPFWGLMGRQRRMQERL